MLLRRKLQCTFILRVTIAQSTTVLARVPYVVLFDLKPLNEDGNLQVCMYCMHARKGASEALRTHFRACKISKFSGRVSPDPPLLWAPFLYLPWAPPILSAALQARLVKQLHHFISQCCWSGWLVPIVGNFCNKFLFASQEPFSKIKSAKILLSTFGWLVTTCKANEARFNFALLVTICIAANRGAFASVPLTAIADAIQEIETQRKHRRHEPDSSARPRERKLRRSWVRGYFPRRTGTKR